MHSIKKLTKHDYLSAFLNIYWLRPEIALWRTIDCMALTELDFEGPVLDLGCGDGLFSFTRAGGRIQPSFDAFSQVANLDKFFDNVDVYDHHDENLKSPTVTVKPGYKIEVGIDHKQALLNKANQTGLYETVVEADANTELPLQSGAFKTVFSNILYWLENHLIALSEARRVMADDGILILQVPTDTFRNYSLFQRLYVRTGDPDWQWLRLLDRGRSDNYKQCKSFDHWENDFTKTGFKIIGHKRYLSKTVLEAWDIGLRPISPFLIEMSNKLKNDDRLEIKRKWVEKLTPLIEPLCELEWQTDKKHPPGFFQFVLEKK